MRTVIPRALAIVPALALILVQPGSVRLPAEGAVAGTVRDAAGAPLGDARIVIVGTSHSALTTSDGRYEMRRIPAGRYALRATRGGYRPRRVEDVAVSGGRTTRQDFSLELVPPATADIVTRSAESPAARDESDAGSLPERSSANQVPREEFRQSVQTGGAVARPVHPDVRRRREPWNTEEYGRIYENRFLDALRNPVSTFSIDVDRASYSNVRRFLNEGRLPPADAVRIEELINYFPYEYAEPTGAHPFSVAADLAPAPWNREHRIVRIGLQGKRYSPRELPPSNLVFLIDVSGSMSSPDKLPLVKQAFRVLVRQLRARDRVAIVVYAGSAGLVLPPTPGSERETILAALERLEAGGSTAGGAGIRLAYEVARRHFEEEGNNRVIIATDGDFNVGVSSEGELVRLIEQKRTEGTFLTVLGFGTGNYKDARMEQLADKGNGNYAYIDNLMEARKVFGTDLTSTLFTVARDVKLQVEFNPARVRGYRLIGYENRLLAREDFNDDTKDAGELGAGHTVTALYEIVPVGTGSDASFGTVDELRYRPGEADPREGGSGVRHEDEWLTIKLRYKPLQSDRSRLFSHTVRERDSRSEVTGDLAFAAAVAAFGMVLRDSDHRGSASFGQALALARRGLGADEHGYRAEFIRLIEIARSIGIAVREE